MKSFVEAYKTAQGWKVKVYDNGVITLCELSEEEHRFVDCVFTTKEEAEEAGRRYAEVWNGKKGVKNEK